MRLPDTSDAGQSKVGAVVGVHAPAATILMNHEMHEPHERGFFDDSRGRCVDKREIRISKSETNSNHQTGNARNQAERFRPERFGSISFENSDLFRDSGFVLRVWRVSR